MRLKTHRYQWWVAYIQECRIAIDDYLMSWCQCYTVPSRILIHPADVRSWDVCWFSHIYSFVSKRALIHPPRILIHSAEARVSWKCIRQKLMCDEKLNDQQTQRAFANGT